MLIHLNEGCKRIAVLVIDRKKGKGGGKGEKDIWKGGEEKEKIGYGSQLMKTTQHRKRKRKEKRNDKIPMAS